ncbi:MAG: phospho-sugar mutase [Clostridiales bacterium]|jgi:phosphoglucomutase|nr:phospho-sugar mutase [Clostridiales bacterium]
MHEIKYKEWIENNYFDLKTREELLKIKDNAKEIEDRFYKNLDFGTAGLRGIIGAGTNRINIYTIRKVTQGLADFLNKNINNKIIKVVIAYDSRLYSKEFAVESAIVLNANNIKTFLFKELTPTPVLSFAVRYLNCDSGIVITASHNPKEYNGYKIYGKDGGQVSSPIDRKIIDCVNNIDSFDKIKLIDKNIAQEKKLFNVLDDDVNKKYLEAIKIQKLNFNNKSNLKIVYTPLNGTGNKLVRKILKDTGFNNLSTVPEQENPDNNFSSVGIPNPEIIESFELALKLAEIKKADIIIATDPDADRIGVMIKNNRDEYKLLSGNAIGVLLCEYILSQRKKNNNLKKSNLVITSIVSTKLTRAITMNYNIDCVEVLTGFKNIARIINTRESDFIFAFEESYGYLSGLHARDKDAIVTSMLVCEMTDHYKSQGLNLFDVLEKIYKREGFYKEINFSKIFEGFDITKKIEKIMINLRENKLEKICGIKINEIRDYKTGYKNYDRSDILYFILEDNSWICIRPSGTEPKLKFYIGANSFIEKDVNEKLKNIRHFIEDLITD